MMRQMQQMQGMRR